MKENNQPEVTISECTRNIPCVDCDNKKCWHAGDIGADCPFYHCQNFNVGDCEHCHIVRRYIREVYGKEVE